MIALSEGTDDRQSPEDSRDKPDEMNTDPLHTTRYTLHGMHLRYTTVCSKRAWTKTEPDPNKVYRSLYDGQD